MIMNNVIIIMVLYEKLIVSGKKVKGTKSKNGNQPPKKRIVVTDDIKIILLYSAKKNNANPIAEYSTLYPDTSSASASGKSNGVRFVSARELTKNIIAAGNNGNTKYPARCAPTMSVKFRLFAKITTGKIHKLNEISYEIIWAAARNPPKKA